MEGHADTYPSRLTERPRLLFAIAITVAALVGVGILIGGAGGSEEPEPTVTDGELASVEAQLGEAQAEVAALTQQVSGLQARLAERANGTAAQNQQEPPAAQNQQGERNPDKQAKRKRKRKGGDGGGPRRDAPGSG